MAVDRISSAFHALVSCSSSGRESARGDFRDVCRSVVGLSMRCDVLPDLALSQHTCSMIVGVARARSDVVISETSCKTPYNVERDDQRQQRPRMVALNC